MKFISGFIIGAVLAKFAALWVVVVIVVLVILAEKYL